MRAQRPRPTDDQIVQAYADDGLSMRQIRDRYAASLDRIITVLHQRGVTIRTIRRVTDEEAEEMRRRYVEQGQSANQIGVAMDRPRNTVLDILHRLGVPMRPPHPRKGSSYRPHKTTAGE